MPRPFKQAPQPQIKEIKIEVTPQNAAYFSAQLQGLLSFFEGYILAKEGLEKMKEVMGCSVIQDTENQLSSLREIANSKGKI